MKMNETPRYFKTNGTDIYASYDAIHWFLYANVECV